MIQIANRWDQYIKLKFENVLKENSLKFERIDCEITTNMMGKIAIPYRSMYNIHTEDPEKILKIVQQTYSDPEAMEVHAALVAQIEEDREAYVTDICNRLIEKAAELLAQDKNHDIKVTQEDIMSNPRAVRATAELAVEEKTSRALGIIIMRDNMYIEYKSHKVDDNSCALVADSYGNLTGMMSETIYERFKRKRKEDENE